MEFKQLAVAMAPKDSEGEAGSAEFIIASLGVVDSDGDIVLPGAIGVQTVPLLPSHDSRHVPIGKATTREVGEKVLASARFNLSIQAARDWHSSLTFDLANGPPAQEYSWGYTVEASDPGRVGGKPVKYLRRIRLHEISPVLRGASVGTGTLSAKCKDCRGHQHPDFSKQEMFEIRERLFAEQRQALQREYLKFLSLQCAGAAPVPGILDGVEALDPSSVPERLRGLASAAVKLAADHLGIATPAVRWFATKGDMRGYVLACEPRVINLKRGMSPNEIVRVASHEVGHLAGLDEAGAQRYEKRFAKEVLR